MNDNIYTPEKWELVNVANKKLLKVYLRSLITKKLRPSTIEQYEADLKFFLVWNLLYNENMCVLNFKKRHFDDFKFFMMEERSVSNARVNRILAPIHMMMEYAEDDDDEYEDYVRNVATKVKGLENNPIKDVAFLSQKQIDLLRGYLLEHEMYKHLFLLDVLYDSGARIKEIFQISQTSTIDKGYIKVICKGGKPEYILLHERAKESLGLYLNTLAPGDPFWKTKYGNAARGTGALRKWVSQMYNILKELDSETPYFTPHSFRHTAIENLSDGTHYLCKTIGRAFTTEEIAMIVHHKSTDMTKSYMKPKDERMIMQLFGIKIA
ncbi:MAG: tyrosine-type recombinase/integrase [Cellulosilyticaceae bacterium]